MRNKLFKIVLLLSIVMLSGCSQAKESSTRTFLDTTQNVVDETTVAAVTSETVTVVENKNDEPSGISREFIEERYPGKIILNYMYAEPELWNGQIKHRYTDEQMVAVNDYLTENGQDYVLYFMPTELESMTLDYVLGVVNSDNPPDIITSVGYNDVVDNSTQKMVFSGIYENLDKYENTPTYEKLVDAYPSGLYDLSLYNGEFYGYKTHIFNSQVIYYAYNKDVADKYGIKKGDIEGKSLSEIVKVLDKIKGWDSEYEKSITASYMYQNIPNFIEPNIYFDNYDREPVFWLDSIGVDVNANNNNVISITDSSSQKKEYEALYEMYKKHYSYVMGEQEEGIYYSELNRGMDDKITSFIECHALTTAGNESDTRNSIWDDSQNMIKVPGETMYTTDIGAWSTINGVCSTSKNKEKALEAIAYICSDKTLSNIMVGGVGSAGYELKNYISKGEAAYSSGGAGNLANQYLVKDTDDIERDLAAKSMEEAKIATGIEGYYFDLSEYKEEVTLIQQIEEDFLGVYNTEKLFSDEYATFEDAWNDFDKQLEEAGIDKVISEINRQRIEIEKGMGK